MGGPQGWRKPLGLRQPRTASPVLPPVCACPLPPRAPLLPCTPPSVLWLFAPGLPLPRPRRNPGPRSPTR